MTINFNEAPFLGTETDYILDAVNRRHICGDGYYSKECSKLLEKYTGTQKALLVHSCTAALEMAAMLTGVGAGDEVICPSFTFVTTASAFARCGAKIVFCDIRKDTLNIDENQIESLIADRTKGIVPVHYAGVSAEMDTINNIAKKHGLFVVEDAAQAVGSFYKGKPCGTSGQTGCYSFHETKNISCGEGGALLINDPDLIEQAEIIREKGTNRSKFFRGQVDKYTWVSLGSSYLPGDMTAAYLYPQLQKIDDINGRRKMLWKRYHDAFAVAERAGTVRRPVIPEHCEHNAHMYYLLFNDLETRTRFIARMKEHDILCVFHYLPLHSSPAGLQYGRTQGDLPVTADVSDRLVRLPLFYGLSENNQDIVIEKALEFIEEL